MRRTDFQPSGNMIDAGPGRVRPHRRSIIKLATLAIALTAFAGLTPPPAISQTIGGPQMGEVNADATPIAPIDPTEKPDLAVPSVSDNYKIGPGDLLSIFVYQMPQFTEQTRVNQTGYVHIPYVTESLEAEGKTPPQLSQDIASTLINDGLAVAPQVRVVVREVVSRPIVVSGAVRYPVTLQATHPIPLTQVLARAGGVDTERAAGIIRITQYENGQSISRNYDLQKLIQHAPEQPIPVMTGNESIEVLPATMVYIAGAFKKPGAFPSHVGQPITILRALALAEGFAPHADRRHATVIKTTLDGQRRVDTLNLEQIVKHKQPDIILQGGDVLYVPEDRRDAILSSATTDALSTLTIAVGYGLSSRIF